MKTKIQINLETLERIVSEIKLQATNNPSLSKTVIIEQVKETALHTGQDEVKVWQVNSYAECEETLILETTEKPKRIALTYNQYQIEIKWFSDLRAFVTYNNTKTGEQVTKWEEIDKTSQMIISNIVDVYCTEQGLTKYSY